MMIAGDVPARPVRDANRLPRAVTSDKTCDESSCVLVGSPVSQLKVAGLGNMSVVASDVPLVGTMQMRALASCCFIGS